ncbi:MAG: M23 family metallopeptidase [Prevotella sp.]|jgi:murein DD-endopeptidase MepM/ murein hydrolase activator NlpD|nr:M23 family metallopeptidase [Prevotella sp.]
MIKRKDKNKHDFWKRIHFKYRLSIINENTLEETMKFRISKFTGFIFFLGFMFFFVFLTSIIIITTPIRNYLPGYLDTEIREQAIHSAVKADSLEQQLLYQAAYLTNLKDVFSGKMQLDSISYVDTVAIDENDPALLSSNREKNFTGKFEDEEKYNISVLPTGSAPPTEGITFFCPVKGMVSDRFNPTIQHYGIDIVAAPKESVVATLEGTVLFVGNDSNVGNVIEIQHKNGFVSVYKHNAAVLKKMGNRVRTGEAIAIVGNTGELSSGDHLHFELWYKGNPVNPELYISF